MTVLAYCDYIADRIKTNLRDDSYNEDSLIHFVDRIEYDLDEDGAFRSTKKTIGVQDVNGKRYRVTVEEITN